MFRMKFQSTVAEEESSEASGSESESTRTCSNVVSEVVIFEGRVGRFGKVRRVVTGTQQQQQLPVHSDLDRLAPWKSRCLGDSDLDLDSQVAQLREFVEPQSVNVVVRDEDEEETSSSSVSSDRCDDFSSECSSFRSEVSESASDGSVAEMNALQRESKTWEEALLALHHQAEVDVGVANEAKEEAKNLVAVERILAARRLRELRDLANCVDLSPSQNSFKKNKVQKILSKTGVTAVCRFFKNPFGLFKTPKIHNGNTATRELGMDSVGNAFSECSPSTSTDAALAQMRSIPRRQATSEIQFATVNSTQRDVPAWTMEEYMTKNAQLHKWNRGNDDEEFGAIEGNNLMNQTYFNDDVHGNYDSDSD